MKSRAVVLLSAGLDSSFNLFRARRDYEIALALTFDYGQKAASQEIAHAKALADKVGVRHQVIDLPWFRDFTKTSLVGNQKVPSGTDVSIDDLEKSKATMKAVWVPNRNGILLNIAAGFAEGLGAHYVIPGFNIEEAATFPDNSQDYMNALDHSFHFSTRNGVKVICYSTGLNKTEIVKESIKLEVPLKDLWPCYLALPTWCGECESCQRFSRAIREAGIKL